MKALDLAHRWTGGLLGLILAILGLSGALLVHKESWIALPHAGDARIADPQALVAATARLLAAAPDARSILYASDRFGLIQLRGADGAGAYADQSGSIVLRWHSQWERPELWLFDLHHHLFTGDLGETLVGISGLAGLCFVLTGTILWWRTRRTFGFRLWPKRLSRPMILWHHRDLGIVMAPLLLLSSVTGAMMVFQPFAALIIAPFGAPSAALAANRPAKVDSGPLSKTPDWPAILATAHARFPDAELRILALPDAPGQPIRLRMRRAREWLPNGRTLLAFDASSGRLLRATDALALPRGTQIFNGAYPLHAAKVGGLAYRLVMTFSGLAMALLGSLAVWSFWFKRPRRMARS